MQTENTADLEDLMNWARQRDIGALIQSPKELAVKIQLNLCRSNLTTLPENFIRLQSLKRLDLRFNPLEHLPLQIGELQQLEMLDIVEAKLTALPQSFSHLHKLNYCRIEARLADLPEDFGQLSALTQLHLSDNCLTTLPESMSKLYQLEQLNLSSNQLTELPEWIGRLPSLVWLDIRGNPLTKLPTSLGESKTLQHLAYDDTIANPPQLACSQKMAKRPLDALQTTFARMLSYFGHQLPKDDVLFRRRGQIGGEDGDYGYGDTVTYLFGADTQGEYLDYYMCHRIAGDAHIRIYEDGSWEHLDVISPFGSPHSDDPIENERLWRKDQEKVEHIRAMLRNKGFRSSY